MSSYLAALCPLEWRPRPDPVPGLSLRRPLPSPAPPLRRRRAVALKQWRHVWRRGVCYSRVDDSPAAIGAADFGVAAPARSPSRMQACLVRGVSVFRWARLGVAGSYPRKYRCTFVLISCNPRAQRLRSNDTNHTNQNAPLVLMPTAKALGGDDGTLGRVSAPKDAHPAGT